MGQVIRKAKGRFEDSWFEKFWIVGVDGDMMEWTAELETMEDKVWKSEQWLFKNGSREWRFGTKDWTYRGQLKKLRGEYNGTSD